MLVLDQPPEGFTMADVTSECQANFEAIVDRAMELGINHFETAVSRHNRVGRGISGTQRPCGHREGMAAPGSRHTGVGKGF